MGAFTSGDIVVYRVGDGASTLSGTATAVFLDEYTTSGTLVQSVALPTSDAGSQHALTASGSATSEGLLSTSADGRYLLLAGYDAAPGTASVADTSAAATPRTIGRVAADGSADTSTALSDLAGNPRSVASVDGSSFYVTGSTGGIRYATPGATTSTQLSTTTTNLRQVGIYGGQVYVTSSSGPTTRVATVGSGEPTTAGQTITNLPGISAKNVPGPYAFYLADLSQDVAGVDTLYVADNANSAIEKFSLSGGSWTASGSIAVVGGITGLAGSVANGNVSLVATTPKAIDALTDTTGYNATLTGTLNTVASASANEAFRGVAYAPSATGTTPPPPATTVSVGDAAYIRAPNGSMTLNFTVTRSDTSGSFTVNYGTTDGSAKAGTDYEAVQGTLTFAANGAATQTVSVPIDPATASTPASAAFNLELSGLTSTAGSAALGKASATGLIADPTPIYTIQGSGLASTMAGQAVTTSGIVTAVASNGYYIQDRTGDGNAATSDGLFVFTGSSPTTAVGDLVAVSGTVQEFKPGSADRGALTSTELSNVTASGVVSHDNALPDAVLIGPDGRTPPTESLAAGNTFYEQLEGMRVTVENPVAVGPTNGFGEIATVAGNGAGATGLNANGDLLISKGQPAFGSTDSTGGDFNPERIKIDSELVSGAVPSANVGTQFGNATGILNYAFNNFGVSATAPLTVTKPSTLTPTVGTLTGDSTHLTVGSYNIENFSASAQGAAKVQAVAGQIVNNLKAPDIIAVQEVQDDSGPTDNGVTSAASNLQALTDAIKAAGGPQYTAVDNPFIGNDTNGGQPGGNIRTVFLYNSSRVSFVPDSLTTIAADGTPIKNTTVQQSSPQDPFYNSRPSLSGQFVFNGQTVTVVNNHFASKGGSGALMGSEQPAFDGGEVQRAGQAQAINTYVDGLLQNDPNARILVTGDLNEFNGEEPLRILQGTASITNYQVPASNDTIDATATYTPGGTQVLTDLESTLPAGQQYDYIFEGNAESLVHTLASSSLASGAELQVIHINSEYADATSDHDPLVARFEVPLCFAAGTRIATTRGDVAVEALAVGDRALTAAGATRAIVWVGHRTIDCRAHPRAFDLHPVRVEAHAFGPNLPARDLLLSPGHPVLVGDEEGEGGHLVPIMCLVNGTSVRRTPVDNVAYWHVELDAHEVLLAEGLPAESYLDGGDRGFFGEAADSALLNPDLVVPGLAGRCRPVAMDGPVVEAARRRLAAAFAARLVAACAWPEADAQVV